MSKCQFWHVCYIKPKSEKIVLQKIEKLNIEAFLPLIKHFKIYRTAKKTVLLPLFSGYIFVNIAPGYRHHITGISEVYRFIKFRDEYAKVSDEEIENLQLLVKGIKDFNQIQSDVIFQQGSRVEVTDGLFKGMKGKIVTRNGCRRIKVEIEALKQSISIEIDVNYLRIIEYSDMVEVV